MRVPEPKTGVPTDMERDVAKPESLAPGKPKGGRGVPKLTSRRYLQKQENPHKTTKTHRRGRGLPNLTIRWCHTYREETSPDGQEVLTETENQKPNLGMGVQYP